MLIRFFYTLLLALAAPLLLFGLYKSKPNKPKFGKRWKEHFGITPKLASNQRPIWIHAASVGETLAATPLIKIMKQNNPEQVIVVTTTTSTGAEQVEKLGDLVKHRYMPIDFAFAVRGFINAVKPAKMLIIETELWPNTLATVSRAGIPITIVNARLSEKSRDNYAKIQPLFNQIHPALASVLCQTQSDADRFISLGTNPNKVTVTGSIKFDISIPESTHKKAQELRRLLGESRPIWIAASTHKGEDEQILKAHHELLKSNPRALLILVPRHPERFDDVFNLCQSQGFKTTRRTSQENVATDHQVYLGNTMGEMLVLIGAADVCFMAGSLIGKKVGGHNMLEPAALKVAVVNGPSYYNFKEITEELIEHHGIIVCEPDAISKHVQELLSNSDMRQHQAEKALTVVQRNQGSLQRTLDEISQ
ncbi:lipid IV(A) 3-deoxy-D-manno-octulosonic acid transferase [Vibrio sp. THAF190c]|uniref:lipid IV(A) 3-deoxy-D-manno-octulosonic acid transferase n=1 Tax=Vibrio sp. THAF190c TaxID=2587865 RepID=UPI00126940ED|nr:lipid IV(A) 3-deoxy-D-manno-octulosonic acid transferase [Vibrio sp. THAF190c]QFT08565.1 3-deoxy-D-manno-octulosonic acid transferase [Vibrio sp. THAF190c]